MKNDKKICALIVSAGFGQRFGASVPKQYLKINEKSVIDYTLSVFFQHTQIDSCLCVIAPNMLDMYHESVTPNHKLLPVAFGGTTRQESVRLGLLALSDYTPHIVLIHDAARPNLSPLLIDNLVRALSGADGACPALPVTDSLWRDDGSWVNREGLLTVQTPQVFDYHKILAAHKDCYDNKFTNFTDDIAVAHKYGLKTSFIQGDVKNYKITHKDDLNKFERDVYNMNIKKMIFPDIRTANGYDVHALTAGEGVILGGVKIDCPFQLQGHSDADVVLHALTDAILGTIAAQDIGYHFSPNDPRWKGADSAVFLRHALWLLEQKGGVINFIDITIICETPKISPHRDIIRQNIASILDICVDRVSVKATTTEKLGFTGRSEGIAAQATVTIFMQNKKILTETM